MLAQICALEKLINFDYFFRVNANGEPWQRVVCVCKQQQRSRFCVFLHHSNGRHRGNIHSGSDIYKDNWKWTACGHANSFQCSSKGMLQKQIPRSFETKMRSFNEIILQLQHNFRASILGVILHDNFMNGTNQFSLFSGINGEVLARLKWVCSFSTSEYSSGRPCWCSSGDTIPAGHGHGLGEPFVFAHLVHYRNGGDGWLNPTGESETGRHGWVNNPRCLSRAIFVEHIVQWKLQPERKWCNELA